MPSVGNLIGFLPMHFLDLPDPVIHASRELGAAADREGLRLFVFGSFARGDARANSDLDLGLEVIVDRPGNDESILRLLEHLETWPSIRPVELVDFRHVSPDFRRQATHDIVLLTSIR